MDRRRVFELSQNCRVQKLGQSDVSVEIQSQLSLLREEKKPISIFLLHFYLLQEQKSTFVREI